MDKMKQYYMTIYSVAYSHCGNYLAAGNSYGEISVFNLAPLLEYEDGIQPEEKQRQPFFKFQAHDSSIYSLVSTKKLIISGSVGEICLWKWSDVKKKESKPLLKINIPRGDQLITQEINGMAVWQENETCFYAGCGDDKVYCFDIETGKMKLEFVGHTDYIHCVALGNWGVDCLSGSEDGSVRMWDARKGKEAHIIEPYKHELSARPQCGQWIGCVAFDDEDEWLVCGGGPALTIWHLQSLSPAVCLSNSDSTAHTVHFHDGTVISGGSDSSINHWSFSGELLAEVPTSASGVFDIDIYGGASRKSLCASGAGNEIDICSDFRFKDYSLKFV